MRIAALADKTMEERVSGFSDKNVYQMIAAAKNQPGSVWIRRTTWGNLCARIVSVGTFTGPEPYYGNPEVRADIFTLGGQLHQANAVIPAAGTYKTWRQIDTPAWWKD